MRSTLAVLCLATVLASPRPSAAGEVHPSDSMRLSQRDERAEILEQLDGQLHRGEWAEAEAEARSQLAGALARKGLLSVAAAVSRLALAEAGEGRTEEALWEWSLAQNLKTDFDPRPFGPPGELLAKSSLRRWDEVPAGLDLRRAEDGKGPLSPARRTGGKEAAVAPVWRPLPRAIRVQAIVDAQGHLQQPVVGNSTYEALAYAVLEAMRGWSFEPAKAGAEPVAAFYELKIPGESKALAEMVNWKDSPLAETEALLRAGRFAEADKKLAKIWKTTWNGAEQPRGFLGVALALRALAQAGLGQEDTAICRWQAAQTLEPLLFGANLSAYGAPGALLGQHPWGESPGHLERLPRGIPQLGEVQRPEPVKHPDPQYPEYARKLRIMQSVVVTSILTKTGTLRSLTLVTPDASSGLEASVLDTVCEWRFKPAALAGQPVNVYYSLTVNFKVEGRDWSATRGGSTGSN